MWRSTSKIRNNVNNHCWVVWCALRKRKFGTDTNVLFVEVAEAKRGEMLCQPFFSVFAFLGKASHPKGNVMSTLNNLELEVFTEEYNNNSDFKESFENLYKSNILDSYNISGSLITLSDDGTTEETETEPEENEEPETQTIVVYENNDYSEALNGLLSNTYFICYFLFAFFIFGALIMVIRFIKSFF